MMREWDVVPERNPDCAHYQRCLDAAANADTLFGCRGCPAYRCSPAPTTDADIAGCLALAIALFHGSRIEPGTLDIGALLCGHRPWRSFDARHLGAVGILE